MADQNNTNSKKPTPGAANKTEIEKETALPVSSPRSSSSNRARRQGKSGSKPSIGGTAVAGAKSTLAKPPPSSNNPQQQQLESYNRTMRRRMEQLGTGPYGQQEMAQTMQQKRKKRIERRKGRIEEKRTELRKSLPGGKVTLGNRNTYFIIAVAALVVVLIVAFVLLRFMWHVF